MISRRRFMAAAGGTEKLWSLDGFLDGTEPAGELTTTLSSVINVEALLSRTSAITVFNAPNLTSIPNQFMRYSAAQKIAFGALTSIPSNGFANMANLEIADFGALTSINKNGSFYDCVKLATLIIRTNSVCTLPTDGNKLHNSPILNGTGSVYVPADLIASYEAADGWSTYYAAGTQFLAIENSIYDVGG